MSTDAAGMPYYDPAGALEFAAKALEPWCAWRKRRHWPAMPGARRQAAHVRSRRARQFHADRVLLGTRSRSKLGKLLLGSVAEQVLRSVNLPVITVGPEAHLPVEATAPNASCCMPPHSERPLARAQRLPARSRPAKAQSWCCCIVLPPIDEMERKGLPTGLDSAAMHELRILAAETGAGCCITVEPRVVHGNPSIEILAEAAEQRASLIVLGATHRSAL